MRQENASHLETGLFQHIYEVRGLRGRKPFAARVARVWAISPALQTSRAAVGLRPLPCASRTPRQETAVPGSVRGREDHLHRGG